MVANGEIDTTYPTLPNDLTRVMVIDDTAAHRNILERQLAQLQLQTVGVGSVADALAALDDTIDLIITDHHMPQVDALALLSSLEERGARVPVMLLSSNIASVKDVPLAEKFVAKIQKPLPRRTLFTALRDIAPRHATDAVPVFSHQRQTPERPAPPMRKMRVLAAEDNRTNRLVFSKMVKSLNITLEFAEDGEKAVELFQSFEPDLVFMDISMPRMDGKQATQEIRKIEARTGGHTPVVAMTAHALPDDDKSILKAGLDHYLTKPLRRAVIEEHILLAQPQNTMPVLPQDAQDAG